MNAGEVKGVRQWQVAWLKAKWRKEADDTKREMDMDEIRLNKKEGNNGITK